MPGADDRSGTFKATQKVQVEEGGNWMLASITQVKAGRYYVERDGVKGGAWMDGSRLRALPDNAAGNALAAQGLADERASFAAVMMTDSARAGLKAARPPAEIRNA